MGRERELPKESEKRKSKGRCENVALFSVVATTCAEQRWDLRGGEILFFCIFYRLIIYHLSLRVF